MDFPKLALYETRFCPFCMRVRSALQAMSLDLASHDIGTDPAARDALYAGGGKLQVPCLRIEDANGAVSWMYESADIISYLQSLQR